MLDLRISAASHLLEGFDLTATAPRDFPLFARQRSIRWLALAFPLGSARMGRLNCHLAPADGAVTAARSAAGNPAGVDGAGGRR